MLEFEWNVNKAKSNFKKHGVRFGEATTVFADVLSVTIEDSLHSDSEERFITIGSSNENRILVVVHADRVDKIRLISARKATSKEKRQRDG